MSNKNLLAYLFFVLLIFVAKTEVVNAQGFRWAQASTGGYVVPDTGGNTFTGVSLVGTIDFDAGPGTFNLSANPSSASERVVLKRDSQGNLIWAKQIGAVPGSVSIGISGNGGMGCDGFGNIYMAGTFQDSIDADPGPNVFQLKTKSADFFVVKLNANGDFIWAKATSNLSPYGAVDFGAMAVDAIGNVFIGNMITGTVDTDPGQTSDSFTNAAGFGSDILIEKLDSAGNYVWGKQMGGSGIDRVQGMELDATSNIYFTGFFTNTADFDPSASISNLTSFGNYDAYVAKLDSMGNFHWVRQIGGSADDAANDLTVDSAGSVYVTGYYKDTTDLNPGLGQYNVTANPGQEGDAFIVKLTTAGDYSWAVALPTYGRGRSITCDASANVYATGAFGGAPDFDPGAASYYLLSSGYKDGYVLSLDSAGVFRWAGNIGDQNTNASADNVAVDHTGNVYVSGGGGTVDADPGPGVVLINQGLSGTYIVKLCQGLPVFLESAADTACEYIDTILLSTPPLAGATYTWTLDGGIVQSGTSNTYQATQSGAYQVTITGLGCAAPSNQQNLVFLPTPHAFLGMGSMDGSTQHIATGNNWPLSTGVFINWGGGQTSPLALPYYIIWLRNGVPFDTTYNTSTSTFKPIVAGTDSIVAELYVSGLTCVKTYGAFLVLVSTGVGISETYANPDGIRIFPNPAKDFVTISSLHAGNQLILSDASGRIIYRRRVSGPGSHTFDLAGLAAGYYLLRIEDKEGRMIVVRSMVKQ